MISCIIYIYIYIYCTCATRNILLFIFLNVSCTSYENSTNLYTPRRHHQPLNPAMSRLSQLFVYNIGTYTLAAVTIYSTVCKSQRYIIIHYYLYAVRTINIRREIPNGYYHYTINDNGYYYYYYFSRINTATDIIIILYQVCYTETTT